MMNKASSTYSRSVNAKNRTKLDRHYGKVKTSTCKYTVTVYRYACRYTFTNKQANTNTHGDKQD